jgi:hypothetical protein
MSIFWGRWRNRMGMGMGMGIGMGVRGFISFLGSLGLVGGCILRRCLRLGIICT